jgi:hypothetical protein
MLIALAPLARAVCSICKKYKDAMITGGAPRAGILPMLSAVRAFQPSREHLTPMHADVLQL